MSLRLYVRFFEELIDGLPDHVYDLRMKHMHMEHMHIAIAIISFAFFRFWIMLVSFSVIGFAVFVYSFSRLLYLYYAGCGLSKGFLPFFALKKPIYSIKIVDLTAPGSFLPRCSRRSLPGIRRR